MPSVLVTGANRGIGFGFAHAYAADGWRVFAACRDPARARELAELAEKHAGVTTHLLDVTDGAQVTALAANLDGEAIDILINNAGVGSPGERFGSYNYSEWMRAFDVNTLGAMRMAEALCEHVARSQHRIIAAITSGLGSIGDNTSGGWASYRASKAALNMAVKTLSVELAPRGICCMVVSPGWVQTDMGGRGANLTPAESVKRMRKILDSAGMAESGRFYHHTGEEYAW